ncbi:MAG: hypothetical protein CMJ58_28895 [Planctomycetaceae bacterium]|nr:hypothetical protein [Planctomycetaceae bacterium]
MPTSGLVITAKQPESLEAIIEFLATEPSIEAAPPVGVRVPLVVDTSDKTEDKRIWEWLHRLPGVAAVDVAFIYLGEPASIAPQPLEPLS